MSSTSAIAMPDKGAFEGARVLEPTKGTLNDGIAARAQFSCPKSSATVGDELSLI
jgi:hypothetical protein